MVRSLALFSFFLIAPSLVVAQTPFDGRWTGSITVEGKSDSIEIGIEIEGNSFTQFFREDGEWSAVSPSLQNISVKQNNALLYWMNAGGIWTETQTFSLAALDEETLSLLWTRHVNNRATDAKGEDWSLTGTGKLTRFVEASGLTGGELIGRVPQQSVLGVGDITYLPRSWTPLVAVGSPKDTVIDGTSFDLGTSFYLLTSDGRLKPFLRSTNQSQYANSVWAPLSMGDSGKLFFMSNSTAMSTADFHYLCSLPLTGTSSTYASTDAGSITGGYKVPGGGGLALHKVASGNGLSGVSIEGTTRSLVLFDAAGKSFVSSLRKTGIGDGVYDDRTATWYYSQDNRILSINSSRSESVLVSEAASSTLDSLSIAGNTLAYVVRDKSTGKPKQAVVMNTANRQTTIIAEGSSIGFLKVEQLTSTTGFLTFGQVQGGETLLWRRALSE